MAQLKETSLNLTLPLASVENKEAGDESNENDMYILQRFLSHLSDTHSQGVKNNIHNIWIKTNVRLVGHVWKVITSCSRVPSAGARGQAKKKDPRE
jgi:hypothetical protein